MKRRVSFLSKIKCWKKNRLSKWFPIKGTHCTVVVQHTVMWTNERVPIRNWRRGLFAAFCHSTECFLVYSSDTLTLPFTEIWFDSRRNWVPTGRNGEGRGGCFYYYSSHLPPNLLCLFQAGAKCSRSGRGWRGGLLSLCQLLFELQASNLSTASSSLLFNAQILSQWHRWKCVVSL